MFLATRNWPRIVLPAGLIVIWGLVLIGVPLDLPTQAASWLVFLALVITPGYLLTDMIGGRFALDWIERLALAFPLGVAVLAVPGMASLLRHQSIEVLATGWMLTSAAVIGAWMVYGVWSLRRGRYEAVSRPWALDEVVLLLLVFGAFVASIPALTLNKIDGDAYAVASFAADALAGLPLNAREPLFGTDLGPGVRMVFNQTLPLTYLWSYLSGVDPITLSATASRAMLALWAVFASYALGKAAGNDSRRFGLLVAAIQMLIFIAAPFLRGDNVSLFYFERTNADKFLVPLTMLPVVFAMAIRYVRSGDRRAWSLAALATVAVSAIHPLVAAMLALGLAAFAGFHLLLGLRSREAWKNAAALGGLVVIVMALPLAQLIISRGEAPLAASFPASVDGWPIGTKMVPALPFIYLPSLDYFGPLPQLSEVDANVVDTSTNPFLMWRLAVNMNRRRLLLFDLNRYVSDPNLITEPPYLLALLLLPLLLWRIRSNVGAQFAVGSSVGVVLVMFNPVLTPLIGSLVMPWILWRFVWVLPYALIIAMVAHRVIVATARLVARPLRLDDGLAENEAEHLLTGMVTVGFVMAAGLALSPAISRNFQTLQDRTTSPYYFPAPPNILAYLSDVTEHESAMVLSDQDLSVTIPAYVANAHILAHRMPTTSEVFPANQQSIAMQRLIDQDLFFRTPYLTTTSIDILRRYDVRYVIAKSGSDLDTQLRLASDWFEWVMDDQSYSLYAVQEIPVTTPTIRGNTAMTRRQWEQAEQFYQAALADNPSDLLALLGLADIAHARGQFDVARSRLQVAVTQAEVPNLHYRLGQLYAEQGQLQDALAAFDKAQASASQVARFHEALGDTCLTASDETCAAEQYRSAAASGNLPGVDSRLIGEADLWRQRGRVDRALPLYEGAVTVRPSVYNQLMLFGAYREAGMFERAETLIRELQAQHPLTAEVVGAWADLMAAQGKIDEAESLYGYTIWLQDIQGQEDVGTRLALAEMLVDANRLEEAGQQVKQVLIREPYNAIAYGLQGDLLHKEREAEEAIEAYRQAFMLDPTRIDVYLALRNQLRQYGGEPSTLRDLLQDAIGLNPDNASLLFDLGDQLQRLGDPQAALDAYWSALEALNTSELTERLRSRSAAQSRAFVYARLAALHEDLGQVDPAMNFYRATVAAAPESPWPQVLLGDALRRRGDLEGAEAIYSAVVQQHPDHVEGYVRLADLLYTLGRLEEAERTRALIPQVAISQLQNQQDSQANLGGLYAPVQNRFADAALQSDETQLSSDEGVQELPGLDGIQGAVEALAVEENTGAIRALAGSYQAREQYDLAIKLYQQRIRVGEQDNWEPVILARYYNDLGDLHLSRRDLKDAREAYEQAVALDAWWPEARLGLAEVFAAQGDIGASLENVQRAVDMAPGAVEAQLALANILDQKGDDHQALAIYQATAVDHPGNAEATLALARALQSRNRRQEAEEVYRQTIGLNPGTAGAYTGLAELYIDHGRFQEAQALLQQAVEVDQQDVTAYIRLGDLEHRAGYPQRAADWYDRAAELSPTGSQSSITLLVSMLQYGNYGRALDHLAGALVERPDDAELLLYLGRTQRALGRFDEAEATLLKAIQADPSDSRPHAELAALRLLQGEPEEALLNLRHAISLSPDEASYYLAASQILLGQRRVGEALALLFQGRGRVLRSDLMDIAVHDIHMLQGNEDQALNALQRAVRENGMTVQLQLALGGHYEALGDLETAEEQYQVALGAYPDDAQPHIALADLALSREESGLALYHYAQATIMDPADTQPFLAIARAYQAAESTDEAIKAYEHVLAFEPTLVDAYVNLAALYEADERWDEAQAVYDRGFAMAPTSVEILAAYANHLVQLDRSEDALVLLDKAIEKSPATANLLTRATLYAELERPDRAEADLQAALVREPGSVDAYLALGDLYVQQRKVTEAHEAYESVVSLAPGLPVGYIRLGLLANSQGDRDKAQEYAEAARQSVLGALPVPYEP